MNKHHISLPTYLISVLLVIGVTWWLSNDQHPVAQMNETTEKKPLYWVAPMDPNFRRDEPGLSPMGMQLVPVYDEPEAGPGVVLIKPNVENQLGVRTEQVTYRTLAKRIRTVGHVRYDDNKLLHVHPRVKGWINELFVKSTGLSVKQGQPLFSLYSPELINAQEEYLLALSRQQQRLIQAAKARLESLQLSAQTIDELNSRKQVMQNVIFHAPADGVVSQLAIREGYYVQPGDQIMSLADLSSVWLEAELTENNLAWIKPGTPVNIELSALPELTLTGVVDFIYPFLDERSKTAQARLTLINNTGQLKPNMIADLLLTPDITAEVLAVPVSAVIRTGKGDRVVWAQGNGRYKSVVVQTGRTGTDYVEILSGLTVGDQVVTAAQFLLDSESSKQSDLQRFAAPQSTAEAPEQRQSARTNGVVNSVNGRTLNISRSAIEKWNRPPATMDFMLGDELLLPETGSQLEFTFEISGGEFIITEIHRQFPEQGHDH